MGSKILFFSRSAVPIILWKLESTDAKWSVNIMFSGWVDLPEVVQLGSSMGG